MPNMPRTLSTHLKESLVYTDFLRFACGSSSSSSFFFSSSKNGRKKVNKLSPSLAKLAHIILCTALCSNDKIMLQGVVRGYYLIVVTVMNYVRLRGISEMISWGLDT